MIPSTSSENMEAQEEYDTKNCSNSSRQKRKVIPATRRTRRRTASGKGGTVDTLTQPAGDRSTQPAGAEETPKPEEDMDTTSAAAHKKVNNKSDQVTAEADRQESPITVSSPTTVEAAKSGEEEEKDSNLSRSVATQTNSSCTSQAIQMTDLSQERV